ncbi:hypothetical protein H4W33_004681 [Kibdelosporangium phytohabitans]|nr:hypothetical protein [Kibdelosporangium phytohabitans]
MESQVECIYSPCVERTSRTVLDDHNEEHIPVVVDLGGWWVKRRVLSVTAASCGPGEGLGGGVEVVRGGSGSAPSGGGEVGVFGGGAWFVGDGGVHGEGQDAGKDLHFGGPVAEDDGVEQAAVQQGVAAAAVFPDEPGCGDTAFDVAALGWFADAGPAEEVNTKLPRCSDIDRSPNGPGPMNLVEARPVSGTCGADVLLLELPVVVSASRSRGIESMIWRVMPSVPSTTAWTADSRVRLDRLALLRTTVA